MSAKLNLYNLGSAGVNVDKSPIHKEDGELLRAQNCIIDPLGVEGGIRKRPGLLKVNSVAAAGAIQGITPVPIAKPTTRRLLAGQWTSDTVTAWNTSTDGFATSPTTGGPDTFDATNALPRSPQKVWTNFASVSTRYGPFTGTPALTYRNRFYYAGNDYTVGTSAPTIHMWDGTTDYLLANIPDNPDDAGATSSAILCMIAADQRIYLTTYDGGTGGASLKGRIFELSPETGALVQLGSRFPISPDTEKIPYRLAWYGGRIWTRTWGSSVIHARTYYIRPGIDTDWTMHNLTADAFSNWCVGMASFQGQLYMSTMDQEALGARVIVLSTLGAYSTSKQALSADSSPGFTLGAINHFGELVVFENNLYATYYNRVGVTSATTGVRTARIYKYDGTSWTVVYNPAADTATSVPFQNSLIHNGVLYLLSTHLDKTTATNIILSTPDGTTWTDVSSGLDNNSSGAFGVIVT